MKRFIFGLEKVLMLRKFKEEERKLALGHAVSILNKIESDIKETAVKRHNAAASRFKNPMEIIAWENYIQRLDMDALRLMEDAARAREVVEEKRALYLEAQKEMKAIEKLEEKQKKAYRKEMLNMEMNAVDELTSARQFI